MNTKAKYWIELAEYDMATANVMLDGKRYLYVGFMCHQTVEKAFKSLISNCENGTSPPKSHDLVKLAKIADIYTTLSDEQADFIEVLLPLNIEARYPSYKEQLLSELTDAKCKNIIKQTEEMLLWIKNML